MIMGGIVPVVNLHGIKPSEHARRVLPVIGEGHTWPALSVVTIVDAVSRQRLTAAPSLSACALISLPK